MSYDALRIKKAKKKKPRKRDIKSYTYKYIIPTPCFSTYFFLFFFRIGYYYYYYNYYYYHIITITIDTMTITITLPLLLLLINCYYVVYRVVKFSGSQRSTRDEAMSMTEDEDKATCPDAISTYSDHYFRSSYIIRCISSFPLARVESIGRRKLINKREIYKLTIQEFFVSYSSASCIKHFTFWYYYIKLKNDEDKTIKDRVI